MQYSSSIDHYMIEEAAQLTFPKLFLATTTDTFSVSLCDSLWIGGNDFEQSGKFEWANGNKVMTYSNWGPGNLLLCKKLIILANLCMSRTT
jgi:hypothetical protein